MSLEVILLLCAFTVHSTTSQPVLEANASNVGIIGGHKESIEDAPFMASLQIWRHDDPDSSLRCGASIIHKQFVLTAAQCCEGSKTIEISVGSSRYLKGKIYVGKGVYTHKLFNESTYDYDVCVIKLNNTLKFGSRIAKIILADDNINISHGTKLKALGWGHTEPDRKLSTYLREVSIPVINETECSKTYTRLTTNMICAGATKKDTCGGDSGGPLTLMNAIQVGITSFGKGACGKVGVYTKVAALRKWINTVIKYKISNEINNVKHTYLHV